MDAISKELIIDRIQEALLVLHHADTATDKQREEDYKRTYAYASGYAGSCLRGVLEELQK